MAVMGALPPSKTHPHHFLKLNYISKILCFTMHNQCVPRRHKNKHGSECATFEEYQYALEYKAPLISTSRAYQFPSA